MKRSFAILNGDEKDSVKPLRLPLMIVGRSKHADIEIKSDLMISRRHLEVRVEPDAVFVKNLSEKGTFLNGSRLEGEVSLNPGDEIEIGHTKLRFDEEAEAPAVAPKEAEYAVGADPGATRVAKTGFLDAVAAGLHEGEEDSQSGTRAVAQGETVFQDPKKLPEWKEQPEDRKGSSAMVWALVIGGLFCIAGALWLGAVKDKQQAGETVALKHAQFGLSINYPSGWVKVADNSEMVGVGVGKEGDADFARVNIYHDKAPQHALTGLTDGFLQYGEEIKKRFPGFQLNLYQETEFNDCKGMGFGFEAQGFHGKGIYILNAETRMVVECFSPPGCYRKYAAAFSSVMNSFQLDSMEPQQFLDFPMPDAAIQQMALSSPGELVRQLTNHMALGELLIATKDVRPENLHRAVQEYKQALKLAIAGPQRSTRYNQAAQGLLAASRLYDQAMRKVLVEIKRAEKEGDFRTVRSEAQRLMLMVPTTDPLHNKMQEKARARQPGGARRQ